jgi:hypothetical protein
MSGNNAGFGRTSADGLSNGSSTGLRSRPGEFASIFACALTPALLANIPFADFKTE